MSTADPTERVELEEMRVELPYDPTHQSNVRLHLDLNLTAAQALELRRITLALDRSMATLRCGRRVVGYNGAIRWILERVKDIQEAGDTKGSDGQSSRQRGGSRSNKASATV